MPYTWIKAFIYFKIKLNNIKTQIKYIQYLNNSVYFLCVDKHFTCFMNNLRYIQSVPILDFRGPYTERGWGGWKNGCNAVVCVSLRLESRPRKALISSAALYTSKKQFFRARDCMIFTLHDLTDFYVEGVTAHCIKITDHNLWPNSKTKLKLKHLWSKGAPGCFGGSTQLAYSAYREDRLCIQYI